MGLLSTNDDQDRAGKSAGEKNSSDDLAALTQIEHLIGGDHPRLI
jgi:hypothetical protein